MKINGNDEQWYADEADRIIFREDASELIEILKVRDAACALYAHEHLLVSDKFPDANVTTWLDGKRAGKDSTCLTKSNM